MTNSDAVDVEALRNFYRTDQAARAILDNLAARHQDRSETRVDRLHYAISEEEDITRADVIRVLRQLEDLGCGAFVVGRKGRESRFAWAVGLTGVGRAAAGDATDLREVSSEATESDGSDEDNTIAHSYVLRANFVARFALPSDLTSAEAARLADFIKTLPFS